jgi:predicted Zn-dependent protease
MLLRVALAAIAVVLVAFAVTRDSDKRACDQARRDAFAVGLGSRPAADAAAVGSRVQDRCRSGQDVIVSAGALLRAGATREALRMASDVARREPARRDAWIAIGRARRARDDLAGSSRAFARARSLDPVGFGATGG